MLNGVDSGTAQTIEGYVSGAISQCAAHLADRAGNKAPGLGGVTLVQRTWFNEAGNSTWFLVPGLIVLVMTLIGAFLTSLLIAREWERGTLESLFVTPVRPMEWCSPSSRPIWSSGDRSDHVPARRQIPVRGADARLDGGHHPVLAALSSGVAGAGAVDLRRDRNQFAASQVALLASFMPAMMLSGFVFDLRNVPVVIRSSAMSAAGDAFHGFDQDPVHGRRRTGRGPARGLILAPMRSC
jgi:ABC-2 type transport system permease protein